MVLTLKSFRWIIACVSILTTASYLARADQHMNQPLTRELIRLVGPQDGLVVAAPNGHILAGIHMDSARIPASILKLLTALTVADTLGLDFRFRTDFFIDRQNNLIIKGYGDPRLVSEEIKTITQHIATQIQFINDIVLDHSYFRSPIHIPGRSITTEPYDAPNGALCVNFNTVAFKHENGQWLSDEPQTPLLPMVIPKIVASGLTQGRITLAADSDEMLQYTGALFKYFLNAAGVEVRGRIRPGRAPSQKALLIESHASWHDLKQVVANLLEYSNNFIANQLLLVMGATVFGSPATVDKGLQVLQGYYSDKLKINTGRIVEASGISRQNRLTPRAMLKILEHWRPYHPLMRHNGRQYYKTGHLEGVRTRAGYLSSVDGGLYCFVVMINTPGKSTTNIMRAIEKYLK